LEVLRTVPNIRYQSIREVMVGRAIWDCVGSNLVSREMSMKSTHTLMRSVGAMCRVAYLQQQRIPTEHEQQGMKV